MSRWNCEASALRYEGRAWAGECPCGKPALLYRGEFARVALCDEHAVGLLEEGKVSRVRNSARPSKVCEFCGRFGSQRFTTRPAVTVDTDDGPVILPAITVCDNIEACQRRAGRLRWAL